ncbi:AAA-type ATPase, N-terminal domain [Dillenia turbinata]|uniref:AAA-type ATPase, N-terminal domain n=1 Tax=Dillenia turbinata TaxID=194707 RepID=A0AAN8Z4F0_9MAGN
MFSLPEMSSTTSKIFSAYASFSASAMLVRSMTNELIPQQVRSYIYSKIQFLFTPKSSDLTLYIEEFCGFLRNQVYESAQIYLASKINPSTQRLKITKLPRQKHFSVSIDKGEEIVDVFDEVELKWRFICSDSEKPNVGEKRFFELTFDKKFKQKVLDFYLPHVLASAKALKEKEKVVKLYTHLLADAQVTPAQVAEELMKSEDADVVLGGLVEFLKRKKLDDEATNVEALKPKRVKIENIQKKLPVRNHRKSSGRGRLYGRSGRF